MNRISTYFGIGCTCDYLYEPKSIEDLGAALSEVKTRSIPWFVVGAGSNSLLSSRHFEGAVVSSQALNHLVVQDNRIVAGAGIDNTELCEKAWESGLSGIGWMNRLPGMVGATVRMNARCYGGEISQVVKRVVTVTPSGKRKVYSNPREVFFGYKDTLFMKNQEIVAEVEFELKKGDKREIRELMDHCEKDRVSKFQFDAPSCGCVFKNDYSVGVPSGMLLESAGAKGLKGKDVQVSPGHANFIFNRSSNSSDVFQLTREMRQLVWEKFGVWMEYEMELLGNFTDEDLAFYKELKKHEISEESLRLLKEKFQNR